MFYYLTGIIAEILPYMAVVDCGGAGYAVNTSLNTLARLKTGEKAKLYTYLNVREDCFELYGFISKSEKRCFELLIGVSGVGPKAALSILSSSTPESLATAIVSGDIKALTVAPGVGKKIAQRVVLELKDKMAKETNAVELPQMMGDSASGETNSTGRMSDAASALAVLGYGQSEISQALRGIDANALSLEEIIRLALKNTLK